MSSQLFYHMELSKIIKAY